MRDQFEYLSIFSRKNGETMKRLFISTAIALLIVLISTSITFAAPQAPEKQLLFKGSTQAIETYEVNFPLMSVTASGSGYATQLGRFTMSYTVAEVNLLTNAGTGEVAEFVA